MVTLETLVVEVDADTTGADTGLSGLSKTADKSFKDVEKSSGGLDAATEKFDTADTRAMGFRDTITGVSDTMKGFTDSSLSMEERLLTLGMGVGDLASGFVNFLIPALGNAAKSMGLMALSIGKATLAGARQLVVLAAQKVAMVAGAVVTGIVTVAQWLWNIAMMANPIGLIIIAIIAFLIILGLLVDNWDTIVKFLKDVWEKAWQAISDFFVGIWDGIMSVLNSHIALVKKIWNGAVDFIADAVGEIGDFFSGMWDGIGEGLKSALNGAISLINAAISGINVLIRGANQVPGVSIPQVPKIPMLADGGIATGPTLAMIGEGANDEAVIPLPRGMRGGLGGGGEVTIRLEGDEDLIRLFRKGIQARGGVNVVFG